MSKNLFPCRVCDESISVHAHTCPKCEEPYELFSCTQCESEITENAFECPDCGKKYEINFLFESPYWSLSIPLLIITSAFILTIMFPYSEKERIRKLEREFNALPQETENDQ